MKSNPMPTKVSSKSESVSQDLTVPISLSEYQSYITVLADTHNQDLEFFYSSALIPFYFHFEGGESSDSIALTATATMTVPGQADTQAKLALLSLQGPEDSKTVRSPFSFPVRIHMDQENSLGLTAFSVKTKDSPTTNYLEVTLELKFQATNSPRPIEGGICIVLETQDPKLADVQLHQPTIDWEFSNGQNPIAKPTNACKLFTFGTGVWPGKI